MKINSVHVFVAFGTLVASSLLFSCSSVSLPKGASAVSPFDKDKYLGKWYEIARLDFKYEKNLDNVTANYTLKDDGSIRVDNRGYDYTKNEWKESIGKAKFVEEPTVGRLKVSFFGPFYAAYNVIAIDKDYQNALVVGNSTKYMWILSRTKTIPDAVKADYLQQAKAIGVDIDALVYNK
ncbi:lipocalin family protein, partial [Pedobacter sp.]|uniref:lipocalin family protein n=1 Tax=Pedobacter sp. TaxID=1411316 RepID=UPI003D7F40E1